MANKFKELTNLDIAYITQVFYSDLSHEEKTEILANKYSVTKRTIRNWWRKLNLVPAADKLPTQLREAMNRRITDDVDILLVTAAQNKTVVNEKVFNSILLYKDFIEEKFGLKVEIVVIPCRYRNPTNLKEAALEISDSWWDERVAKYLYYDEILFGDVLINPRERINPTAQRPLRGLEPRVEKHHYIIGHPRLHIKTMPRFWHEPLFVLASTGYVTYKNYSESKAGGIAAVHHTYSFLVIERKDAKRCFIPRGVKVNLDGTFTDYKYYCDGNAIREISSSIGFIFGDIHHHLLNEEKFNKSCKIISELNPKSIVLHDVFDGYSINPHEQKDYYIRRKKVVEGVNLEDEVERCLEFLKEFADRFDKSMIYVVHSNHDDFLDRYINDRSWKQDLINSPAYLKYAYIQQTENLENYGNLIGYLIHHVGKENLAYVPSWQSLEIGSYQCGYHGHTGVNGAKGSVTAFTRLNKKMIHGHVHGPEMCDGVTAVGVSCQLWQYYNRSGLSNWAYADSIIHNCGKNQLIIYDDETMEFTNLK